VAQNDAIFLQMRCGHFHTEFGVHQSKDLETVLDQTDVFCPPMCRLYWKQDSAGRYILEETIFEIFASLSTTTHRHKIQLSHDIMQHILQFTVKRSAIIIKTFPNQIYLYEILIIL
jgi:UTP-glucose-1-phosphate uridylyltransferase